ncbi:3-phenylpropionate/trans-cinnamate dioxygenase ferredoxin reductase subunit [Panacagrimonas perspica]|uniref:3-phenylpropionate/trans-cinnamate dioxygenase ferredoxin reductase subunit n=2 Tax=Panacagrimonas perspica TaxID=381431 RepID=A0A4R7PAY8_9GAMM|nr:3-phenylpropionate/trans-cinnamate dioxygenase ferredoxin reductase subunit [Panacagrimonas perspica]THD02577.1 hypothetical protein B1810_13565 [Panacagrimonas perspica]
MADAVIIGAGQAGIQAALSLRAMGFDGRVRLLGDEAAAPYQRPPLSKGFLLGKVAESELLLRSAHALSGQAIEWLGQTRVRRINRPGRSVETDTQRFSYDALIIATGGRAHRPEIEGASLQGVETLRSIDDALRIRSELAPGKRLVILGGGYIGLEVAAASTQAGCKVVVVEGASRVLCRVAPPALSQFFEKEHRARGVEIELSSTISRIVGTDGKVSAVELESDRVLPADIVLLATGLIANDELAVTAGLPCNRGILVNEWAATEDPRIFAIGDVAVQYHAQTQAWVRMESVANAVWQGKMAASCVTSSPPPLPELPWFWSDQFDIKLQIAGLSHPEDEIILRGDPGDAKFCMFTARNGVLTSVSAVNSPGEFLVAKRLVAARRDLPLAALRDRSVALKQYLLD